MCTCARVVRFRLPCSFPWDWAAFAALQIAPVSGHFGALCRAPQRPLAALCPRFSFRRTHSKSLCEQRAGLVPGKSGRRPKCTTEQQALHCVYVQVPKRPGRGGRLRRLCGGEAIRWWRAVGGDSRVQLQNGRYSFRAAMCCDSQGHCGAKVKALRAHGRGAGDS